MKLTISHSTEYQFDQPVSYALQQVRLCPQDTSEQKVLSWDVAIEGGSEQLRFEDQHQNQVLLVLVDPDQTAVSLRASGTVETRDTSGMIGQRHTKAPLWHYQQNTERTKPGKGIQRLGRKLAKADDKLGALHALSREILANVPYKTGETLADTTAEEAFLAGAGVCQDHAQIFAAAARFADLPARYVSGYLMMNDRVDQDASHAWAEVNVPGLGWVGFDVSNGISPDERYVKIATGLDSRDAAPIRGMRLGASGESMIVSVQVQQ